MPYSSPLPRCVYILGDGLLFDEIITHMLILNTRLRVISRVYHGEAVFLTEVNLHQPDVILLNQSELFDFDQILALLSTVSLTTDLRVIRLGMNDNMISIYDLPACQKSRWSAVHPVRRVIASSNELLDLVGGRQVTA
jgi:hypothetical protein